MLIWWIDSRYGPTMQQLPVATPCPVSIPPTDSGDGRVPCFGQWDNSKHSKS